MSPSVNHRVSLLDLVRSLWMGKFLRSVATGLIVLIFLAANMGSGLTQAPPGMKTKAKIAASEHHQSATAPLLLPKPAKALFHGQWMTEAAMTSHNLTAAHFLGHRVSKKLFATTQQLTKQGS